MARKLIFGMFRQSPFRPLQEHMTKVLACVEYLSPFIKAVLNKDWKKAAKIQKKISRLEEEADILKKDFRLHMPKGLLLPIARTDLLELLRRQDNVANQARHIAGLVYGRTMEFPESIVLLYQTFVDLSVSAAKQAHKAISELDELFESGFKGSEVDVVSALIETLDRIENETDTKQIEIRQKLFAIENELPPINAMFLYKVIEWTGELADRAQRVGSHLQLLLAR